MKRSIFLILLFSLAYFSCKKETNFQYRWLKKYQGDFQFNINDTVFNSGDPFASYSQSKTSIKNYSKDGTITRTNGNKIKIQIAGCIAEEITVDQNKNLTYSFDDGGSCGGKK